MVRQDGGTHRRLWQQRRTGEYTELVSRGSAKGAAASRVRAADQEGLRAARNSGDSVASCDSHQADQRPRCLLLCDGLRPRLLDQGELPIHDRPPPASRRDRQPGHHHRCHGARGLDRQGRQSHRRQLYRQGDGQGCACEGTRRRPRGQWLRKRAHLLNSKTALFPNGLANGSGKVGRYLMDTVGSSLSGQIPALENCPPHNEDGASAMHMYMPWWQYQEQLAGKLDFARGYHIEFHGGRRMPAMGNPVPDSHGGGSYGRKYKEDARRYYGSVLHFAGRGEMIPNEDSYCELDPDRKDHWGIPALRFQWKWTEHETRQAAHMQKTFAEIISAMGGSPSAHRNSMARRQSWPGARSSTRSARRVWATIQGNPSSTNTVSPGRCRISLSRMAAPSPRMPTRIPRSASWPSPCVPALIWPRNFASRTSANL